jgi:hypothetical protein
MTWIVNKKGKKCKCKKTGLHVYTHIAFSVYGSFSYKKRVEEIYFFIEV